MNAPARAPAPVVLLPCSLDDLVDRVADAIVARESECSETSRQVPLAVTGKKLCELLSLSRSTLHRMRVEGMPAIPVGDTFRYEPTVCLEWLRTRSR